MTASDRQEHYCIHTYVAANAGSNQSCYKPIIEKGTGPGERILTELSRPYYGVQERSRLSNPIVIPKAQVLYRGASLS